MRSKRGGHASCSQRAHLTVCLLINTHLFVLQGFKGLVFPLVRGWELSREGVLGPHWAWWKLTGLQVPMWPSAPKHPPCLPCEDLVYLHILAMFLGQASCMRHTWGWVVMKNPDWREEDRASGWSDSG